MSAAAQDSQPARRSPSIFAELDQPDAPPKLLDRALVFLINRLERWKCTRYLEANPRKAELCNLLVAAFDQPRVHPRPLPADRDGIEGLGRALGFPMLCPEEETRGEPPAA